MIQDPQHIDAQIGAGLAGVLGLKGTRQAPSDIDFGDCGIKWDLGQGGFAGLQTIHGQVLTSAINGVSSQTKEMIAPNGIANVVVPASSLNCRVDGCYAILVFDAAGAAAFAGKRVAVYWSKFSVVDNFQVDCFGVVDTVVAAQIGYRLWPATPPKLLIPDTFRFRATIISLDGTVFPANTTWNTGVTGYKQYLHAQVAS